MLPQSGIESVGRCVRSSRSMVTAQSRFQRCRQARALRWTCVLGALALVGCALPRRDAPPTLFSAATPVDFPADVRFLSTDRASVEAKSTAALQRLRISSKDGVVRALVLSGGGAGGAFGAGALVGLSRRQERPQYDVVTGVSTGALIAPFAFLGPEWDSQLTEAFTSGRGEPMSVRGLLAHTAWYFAPQRCPRSSGGPLRHSGSHARCRARGQQRSASVGGDN